MWRPLRVLGFVCVWLCVRERGCVCLCIVCSLSSCALEYVVIFFGCRPCPQDPWMRYLKQHFEEVDTFQLTVK